MKTAAGLADTATGTPGTRSGTRSSRFLRPTSSFGRRRLTGHSDAGFTLKVYARDGRDEGAVVEDVLARAAAARIGG